MKSPVIGPVGRFSAWAWSIGGRILLNRGEGNGMGAMLVQSNRV